MERKCNSDQWWNKDKYLYECKNCHVCQKDSIWNLATYSCQNGKYLASIMDDSKITCDGIVGPEAKLNDEETKSFPTSFNGKNITYKT